MVSPTWLDDLISTQQPKPAQSTDHRAMFHQFIPGPRWIFRWIPIRWTSSNAHQKKDDSRIKIAFHEKLQQISQLWKYKESYQAGWPKGLHPLGPKFLGLSPAPSELKQKFWYHMLRCLKYNVSINSHCNMF